MDKRSLVLSGNMSASLRALVERQGRSERPTSFSRMTGFSGKDASRFRDEDKASAVVELDGDDAVAARLRTSLGSLERGERFEKLDPEGTLWSAELQVGRISKLWGDPTVKRVHAKKESRPNLESVGIEVGVLDKRGARSVPEDGTGVLVGVVDSGFDLSHPMFRDAAGNLRVEGLLDQTVNREYTGAEVAKWLRQNPGGDDDGHGTHVASIAAGLQMGAVGGVAPGARLLLVKTDFVNTDLAVAWIFRYAGARPCVVNLSLGRHLGAHDGTDPEERLYERLTSIPGRAIVVSAGNERREGIHLGGRFHSGQSETCRFELVRQDTGGASAILSIWYPSGDDFEGALITPTGQELVFPVVDGLDQYSSKLASVDISRKLYAAETMQVQISIDLEPNATRPRDLVGWGLRVECRRAVVGRLDAWFHNSGCARFQDHELVEEARTVGIPGTGMGTLTVASYTSKAAWMSEDGPRNDGRVVVGRTSRFSSLGPTRDGREKPELCAPGEYVTGALAQNSICSRWTERTHDSQRLVTIEGTSMAAPVVTGAVALMLQCRPSLMQGEIREILTETARRDAHVGKGRWTTAYGYGKIEIAEALEKVRSR